jgi:hypothetical protein
MLYAISVCAYKFLILDFYQGFCKGTGVFILSYVMVFSSNIFITSSAALCIVMFFHEFQKLLEFLKRSAKDYFIPFFV